MPSLQMEQLKGQQSPDSVGLSKPPMGLGAVQLSNSGRGKSQIQANLQ